MKVLNLRCAHDHGFEGWFGSEDDFQSQMERGLIECPFCNDKTITRLPSAPRLNVGKSKEPAAPSDTENSGEPAAVASNPSAEPITTQALWLKAVQHVLATTDDVGERFAEEARRMHYGETKERAIRGKASSEDAQALREEGIDIVSLPIPAALKGPVQ
jgi:hypothetical protein